MNTNTSRRNFFKNTGAVSAATMLAGVGAGLTACGGDSTSSPLSESAQLDLSATQVLAAYKAGTLTATAYVTTMVDRAKTLQDLNAMITLDEAGALAAAKIVDADRAAGKTLGA